MTRDVMDTWMPLIDLYCEISESMTNCQQRRHQEHEQSKRLYTFYWMDNFSIYLHRDLWSPPEFALSNERVRRLLNFGAPPRRHVHPSRLFYFMRKLDKTSSLHLLFTTEFGSGVELKKFLSKKNGAVDFH